MLLDLEGHGREEDGFAGVDLTRTVGWFTSLYPVRLDPGAIDLAAALSGGAPLGRALKSIKEQLRAVPQKGLHYGLLRYLNGDTAQELSGLPAPELGFNYLGRFGRMPRHRPAMARAGRWRRSSKGWRRAIRRCRLRI